MFLRGETPIHKGRDYGKFFKKLNQAGNKVFYFQNRKDYTKSLKLTAGQFENVKLKNKNEKLRNPDFVGMAFYCCFSL